MGEWGRVRAAGPSPGGLPRGPTLLCRLLARQESPSLIHMPRKVLLEISHSCQMLGRKGLVRRDGGACWGRGSPRAAGRPSHPRIPLYAFQRKVCSCCVTLWKGHSSYLYLGAQRASGGPGAAPPRPCRRRPALTWTPRG